MVKVYIEKDEYYPVYDAIRVPDTGGRPFEYDIEEWRLQWMDDAWAEWHNVQEYLARIVGDAR